MRRAIWLITAIVILIAGQAFARDQVIAAEKIKDAFRAPVVLDSVRPARAFYAPNREVEGYVTLAMLIDEKGEVDEVKVIYRTSKIAVHKAIDAATRWKFEPATVEGAPVKSWVAYNFPFGLNLESYEELAYQKKVILDEESVLALNK